MSIFSINDMFSLLIKELINRGYNDLICEVAKDNFASFYMMRKCGFVIIDEKPTLYGDYVLHNYLPGVIKLADRPEYANSDALPEIMQKLDKKNLYRAEELIDSGFIQFTCRAKKDEYTVYVDTLSGNIAGVHMNSEKFKVWPCDNKLEAYSFDNFNEGEGKVTVKYLSGDEVIFSKDYEEKHFTMEIPENVEKVSFKIEGDEDTYTYFIGEMREQGRYEFAQSSVALNDFALEEKSAFLSYAKDGVALFKEMWPHICAPYIEGIFRPNYEKNVTIERIDQP